MSSIVISLLLWAVWHDDVLLKSPCDSCSQIRGVKHLARGAELAL